MKRAFPNNIFCFVLLPFISLFFLSISTISASIAANTLLPNSSENKYLLADRDNENDEDCTIFYVGELIPINIYCGLSLMDESNLGSQSFFDNYSCSPDNFIATEGCYRLDISFSQYVSIALSNIRGDNDLNVSILTDINDPFSCVAQGVRYQEVYLQPGIYYIIVDGLMPITSQYDLSISCGEIMTPSINCGDIFINQSNVTGISNDEIYGCHYLTWNKFRSQEKIYVVNNEDSTKLKVSLTNTNTDKDWLLLSNYSDPTTCLGVRSSGDEAIIPPGAYFLIVDGEQEPGVFDIALECDSYSSMAVTLDCGEVSIADSTSLGENYNVYYGCTSDPYNSKEKSYLVEITQTSRITATLSNKSESGRVFILQDYTDPSSCISNGVIEASIIVSPGIYSVVVETDGKFDLEIDCRTPQTFSQIVTCGQIMEAESNYGGKRDLYFSPCRPGRSFSGGEKIYEITLTETKVLSVALLNETAGTEAIILDEFLNPLSCINWGSSQVSAKLNPGTYYIVVDVSFRSYGLVGSYDISFNCLELPVPVVVSCGEKLTDQTNEGPGSLLNNYSCASFDYSGPEAIYELTVTEKTHLRINTDLELSDSLRIFVLRNVLNNSSCVSDIERSGMLVFANLDPGTYFIIVDGIGGKKNSFEIEFVCETLSNEDRQIVSCGNLYTNQNNLSQSEFNFYPIINNYYQLNGPESVYEIEITEKSNIAISVSESNYDDFYVFILLDPDDQSTCIGYGYNGVFATLEPGTYFFVVDSYRYGFGNYDIYFDCKPYTPALPIDVLCGQTLIDQTNTDQSELLINECYGRSLTGPERIYRITTIEESIVEVSISKSHYFYASILTDYEDPSSCLSSGYLGEQSTILPAGTYYIVVDGASGYFSSYDITIKCSNKIANQKCTSATPLICGQSVDDQISTGAVEPDLFSTNFRGDYPGLWYSFLGTGDTLTVSLCDSLSEIGARLTVFEDDCVTFKGYSRYYTCGDRFFVMTPTELGKTYKVRVTNWKSEGDAFRIRLSCQDDSVCLDKRRESGDISTGTYVSESLLQAEGRIENPNVVIFDSRSTEFLEGFEVASGMLEVRTDGCN